MEGIASAAVNPPGILFRRSVSLLSALIAFSTVRGADDWAPNLTTTATWHRNATLADQSEDQIESMRLNADMLASKRYQLGRDDSVQFTGHLAGDWWPRYNGLLRGAAGGRAEARHQFGADALAPVIAVEGAIDGVEAKESQRRGIGAGVTVRASKRLNPLTRATVWYEAAWFDAQSATFDSGASEMAIELDRDLNPVTRLTFTARYRDGDIVSYASGFRPELEARAPNRVETDTFDRLLTAYRIDAQTWSGRLAFVRAFDASSALLVAYEYRETKRGPLRFPDHSLTLGVVYQF